MFPFRKFLSFHQKKRFHEFACAPNTVVWKGTSPLKGFKETMQIEETVFLSTAVVQAPVEVSGFFFSIMLLERQCYFHFQDRFLLLENIPAEWLQQHRLKDLFSLHSI